MIFIWLRTAFAMLLKLFVPPPSSLGRVIDINRKCPVCGHRSGKLLSVFGTDGVACQHQCQICGVRFFEAPITAGKELMKFVVPVEMVRNPFAGPVKVPTPIQTAAPVDIARANAIISALRNQDDDGTGLMPISGGQA